MGFNSFAGQSRIQPLGDPTQASSRGNVYDSPSTFPGGFNVFR